MSRTVISVAVLTLVLSGCASVHFHKVQPDKMYEGTRPLSDTAVFSAHDMLSSICPLAATIRSVDNMHTSKWNYPIWVRVAPGTHSFLIECTTDVSLGFHKISGHYVDLNVTILDMKPRHVYVARYSEAAGKYTASADDLGEKSYYAIELGGQLVKPEF